MKVMGFEIRLAMYLSSALLILGCCGTKCDKNRKVASSNPSSGSYERTDANPMARSVMKSVDNIDLVALWAKIASFRDAVASEKQLVRLELTRDQHLLAILARGGGLAIYATLTNEKLIPTSQFLIYSPTPTPPSQYLNKAEEQHILAWVEKCKENGVLGFDIRTLPDGYYRITISYLPTGTVHFVIPTTTLQRELYNTLAKEGFDSRGDIVVRLTDDVFVATERR